MSEESPQISSFSNFSNFPDRWSNYSNTGKVYCTLLPEPPLPPLVDPDDLAGESRMECVLDADAALLVSVPESRLLPNRRPHLLARIVVGRATTVVDDAEVATTVVAAPAVGVVVTGLPSSFSATQVNLTGTGLKAPSPLFSPFSGS